MSYTHYSISVSDDSTSTTSRSSDISLNSSMKISNRLIVDGVDLGPNTNSIDRGTAKDRLRALLSDSDDSTDSSDDDSI